ncbi:unnamed protein product [Dibothriocephalus latus]|uniref:Uncharacterized protein n=1 Tax=Dibothriocephalus latus TaxID=60516 RepID=A0A3P7KYH6_DIBLA|nr:unnamed protein product [Dibothriocephalus latus]
MIRLRNAIALCLVCTQSFICASQLQLLRQPEDNERERDQKQRVLRNDIQRLLSESDWPQGEPFMQNRTLFNTTLIGKENYTSYWHLSADAPVAETLDAAQRIHVPKFIEGKMAAVAEGDRGGQCFCPGTNTFPSHLVPAPILITVMGCVFIALNSVWVFRIFFLKRSLCRSANSGEPKYSLTSSSYDTSHQLRSKAQCYERLVDIYLSLHIHATLTVIIFFLLRMCLHTVLHACAMCLLLARKRKMHQVGNRQTTVLLYDLANGGSQSVADRMKPTDGPSSAHFIIQSPNGDSRRGLQIGRVANHPTYGSIALRLLGCLHSLTILTSLCVSGLVVCGFRIAQASLSGINTVEETNFSDLTEPLLSPAPPMRYDIIEKITNLLEILTIGLVYPLYSICLSTRRFSPDADVQAASSASSPKYVCEPSVGFPAAQRRPSLTMAAGTGFVKPKSQIPAKALLEIPSYTRCQFYASLKTDDKNERVIVEPGSAPDSILFPLDNCEIK